MVSTLGNAKKSKQFMTANLCVLNRIYSIHPSIYLSIYLSIIHSARWTLEEFLFGALIGVIGLPFFFVSSASLYSKLLPVNIQG